MSNVYEICFTGQIDSISPEDVDFILQVEVTDIVDTKGNFSRLAETPEEFYGERCLEWEIKSGDAYEGAEIDLWLPINEVEKDEVVCKYLDKIEELLWEAIDTARDEEYIDAHEPRYLEE